MSTPHDPSAELELQHDAATIGRAPRAAHAVALAQAANHALLDVCPRCAFASEMATSSTYSVGYTPSTHARWLWLEWVHPPEDIKGGSYVVSSSTVDLTIRDTSGGSWSTTVPFGFNAEPSYSSVWDLFSRFEREVRREGWVDLDAVRASLTGTDWTLELAVVTGIYVSRFVAWECPRFLTDETVATIGGCNAGLFAPHAPIVDGATSGAPQGLERILVTIEAARQVGRTYLSLTWPEDTTAAIPQTAATSAGAMTNLEQTDDVGTVAVTWKIRVRRLYAASADGESIRWRVRYRMASGTTETARVYLNTGATDSPWTISLDYTETWTWTAWETTAMVPTNGSGTLAVLSLEGKVNSAGPTLYVAGIQVEETPG